jgi:hypothetical protein
MLVVLRTIARRNGVIYDEASKNAIAKFLRPTPSQLAGVCELLVSDPAMWHRLDEPQRILVRGFIQSYAASGVVPASDVTAVGRLVALPALRDEVLPVFAAVSLEQQAAMIDAASDRSPYIPIAIQSYAVAADFRNAERRAAALILPLSRHMTDENVNAVLEAVKTNRQIWQAGRTEGALIELHRDHPGAAWESFLEWVASNTFGVSYSALRSAVRGVHDDDF